MLTFTWSHILKFIIIYKRQKKIHRVFRQTKINNINFSFVATPLPHKTWFASNVLVLPAVHLYVIASALLEGSSPVVLAPLLSSVFAVGRLVSTAEVCELVEHPMLSGARRGLDWCLKSKVRGDQKLQLHRYGLRNRESVKTHRGGGDKRRELAPNSFSPVRNCASSYPHDGTALRGLYCAAQGRCHSWRHLRKRN